MIIEREGRINKPRRGVMALAKNNVIPSGFGDGLVNFL